MDSIFTGYKIIPVDELEEDDRAAIEALRATSAHRPGQHERVVSVSAIWFTPTMALAFTPFSASARSARPTRRHADRWRHTGTEPVPSHLRARRLLVIDAVDVGESPGTVIRFEGKALSGLPGKPTVHQLGFADLMIAMKLLGEAPEEVVVMGVQPVSTEWGAELTPPVQATLPALLDVVIEQLHSWEGAAGGDGNAESAPAH